MAEEGTFNCRAEICESLINAIYKNKNKEIFIRELISNSFNALEKIRFESLTDKSKLDSQPDLFIHIVPDKTNKSLSIIDSGIGMTAADLEYYLGVVGISGTLEYKEALPAGADVSMTGQSGVGFYSAFLVADKVVVTSKHNDDEQYVFKLSLGGSRFIIGKDTSGESLGRGTKITLFLKEEHLAYLNERTLKNLVKKHCSEFIRYPVSLWVAEKKGFQVLEYTKEGEDEKKKRMAEKKKRWAEKKKTIKQLSNLASKEQQLLFGDLCKKMKEVLGDKVQKVVVCNNVYTPCKISRETANMEINPDCPLIKELKDRFDADKNDQGVDRRIWILYRVYMKCHPSSE